MSVSLKDMKRGAKALWAPFLLLRGKNFLCTQTYCVCMYVRFFLHE